MPDISITSGSTPPCRTSVNTIREVFNYIKRYSGKLFVLKIEDCLLSSPLFPLLMKDVVQLHDIGISIIIVTGTRVTIERNLERAGVTSEFADGVRITTTETLPHVKLAAMEVAETVISHLAAGGANGVLGNWIKARALGVRNGVDFQWTGQVEKIRSDILHRLLEQRFIPVMYNIGFNTTGKCYNVNSSHNARHLALALNAIKLFFIGEDNGISSHGLTLPEETQIHDDGTLSNLDLRQVDMILRQNAGRLSVQDREYLENAVKVTSIPGGVKRVHIINGNREGSLLNEVFSSSGGGTMIYSNKHAGIRRARTEDIPAVLQLMDGYVRQGNLVSRTTEQIVEHMNEYYIYEVDQVIYGCGALYDQGNGWGEIGAVAVHPFYRSQGVGERILQYLIDMAGTRGFRSLFLLTTRATDWFLEFGFVLGNPGDLPETRRQTYNTERNSRVLILHLTNDAGR